MQSQASSPREECPGQPKHRPPPGWGVPPHLARGYSAAYRKASTPNRSVTAKDVTAPQISSDLIDRHSSGREVEQPVSATPSANPAHRSNVSTDWNGGSIASSPDEGVKLNGSHAAPTRQHLHPPDPQCLASSRWAPSANISASSAPHSFNTLPGKLTGFTDCNMAEWNMTALEAPPTSQGWPSLPGNDNHPHNPVSRARNNSSQVWGSQSQAPSAGQHQQTKSRTPSLASSRGGKRPRGNTGRYNLVPAQVNSLKQAQDTLNSANAEFGSGAPLSAPRPPQDHSPPNWNSHGRDRVPSFSQNMKAAKRRSKWPSPADFKGPPEHEAGAEDDALDVASAQADAGDGLGKMFRPIKPGDDATLDIRDWNGDWAPAPPDWEERPMFVGLEEKRVAEWKDGYEESLTTLVFLPNPDRREDIPCRQVTLPDRDEFLNARGEICPQDWIVNAIDSGAAECGLKPFLEWWADEQRKPLHTDVARDTDDTTKPYWDRYTGWSHDQLTPLRVPDAKVDPRDNDVTTVQRQTAEISLAYKDNEQLRRVDKQKKDKKERLRVERHMENYVPARNEYSPQVNIYMRPYAKTDVPSIQEFYNYWIENSVYAAEMKAVSRETLEERIANVVDYNLPCIVAVDRSNKPRNGRNYRQRQSTQPEHIVGFAFADDWHDDDSIYRYAVEVECYVRPDYVRKGVGRTLMDKLMSVLDIGYEPVGGYEFVCNQDDMEEVNKYTNGGKRQIGQIIIQLLHTTDDRSKLDWNANWLKQRWGFKQKGYLDDIGRKLSSSVSLAIYGRKTSIDIPKAAP